MAFWNRRRPIDGMAELWFDDAAKLRAWVASKAGKGFVHDNPLLEPLAVYAVEERQII